VEEIWDPEKKFSWTGLWWHNYGFDALGRLLDRPWFRRGWVLQEAAFSTNSIIQCGDSQVYMNNFAVVMDLIRARFNTARLAIDLPGNRMRSEFIDKVLESPAVKMLDMIEGAFSKSTEGAIIHHRQSLETLVHLSTFCETSDERDSIYALLNIANDTTTLSEIREHGIILPDYGKSVLDVYADFVIHCCQQSESLDILCRPWAQPPSTSPLSKWRKTGDDNTIPSWIRTRDTMPFGNPSWRLKRRLHGNSLVGGSQKRLYNAHYRTRPAFSIGRDDRSGACDGSLIAKGVFLANISEISTRMADAIVTRKCLKLLGPVSWKTEPGNIVLPDAIWRTLCADRDERGDPATSSFRVGMLELLQTNVLESTSSIDIEDLLENELPEHVRRYLNVVRDTVWNRRTFRSQPNDYMRRPLVGLIPQRARVGDHICILYGCSVPVVLRKMVTSIDHWWEIVGEAYVHGIMDGEVFRQTPQTTLKHMEEEFFIW
jgi:hypothetical protein